MGFFRPEYQSELPCPPPGDLSNPGIEPTVLTSPALAGRFFTTSATWEAYNAATIIEHPPCSGPPVIFIIDDPSSNAGSGWLSQHIQKEDT